MKRIIQMITILVTLAAIYFYTRSPASCNMKIPANHFTTPTADKCNSNIIYRSSLPKEILELDNRANSFLVLAKYGSGKTLLRCEYFKSLSSTEYFKVPILNGEISEYLDRHASTIDQRIKDCEAMNCLKDWSENEFAQLLLSSLVTEFVNGYRSLTFNTSNVSRNEKIQLITIICYYYSGLGINTVENFINYFLGRMPTSYYRAHRAQIKVREKNIVQDKPLLKHFKKDFDRFTILNPNDERLHLLLMIVEGEEYEQEASERTLYENTFQDLALFASFIQKYVNRTPVLIIDGIDENRYFFQRHQLNKASLETFVRSTFSQRILEQVMENNFILSIFYPKVNEIHIEDFIIQKDRFPLYAIEWNKQSLLNYADYVLQQINNNASDTRCTPLPDFSTLINLSNEKVKTIFEKILTPRALHYFMISLIHEMNKYSNSAKEPFRATYENVHAAYQDSYQYFEKNYKISY